LLELSRDTSVVRRQSRSSSALVPYVSVKAVLFVVSALLCHGSSQVVARGVPSSTGSSRLLACMRGEFAVPLLVSMAQSSFEDAPLEGAAPLTLLMKMSWRAGGIDAPPPSRREAYQLSKPRHETSAMVWRGGPHRPRRVNVPVVVLFLMAVLWQLATWSDLSYGYSQNGCTQMVRDLIGSRDFWSCGTLLRPSS
jgi:hypothetical protein